MYLQLFKKKKKVTDWNATTEDEEQGVTIEALQMILIFKVPMTRIWFLILPENLWSTLGTT